VTGTRTTAAGGRTDAPATGTRTTGSSAGDASCGIGNCGISHQQCRGAVMCAWPLQVESNPGMCCEVPRTSGCVVCLQNIQKGGVVAQSDRYASQRFHLASIHSSWKACTHKTHTSGALCSCGPLGRVIHDRFHGEHEFRLLTSFHSQQDNVDLTGTPQQYGRGGDTRRELARRLRQVQKIPSLQWKGVIVGSWFGPPSTNSDKRR